jgi:hypothetical protein
MVTAALPHLHRFLFWPSLRQLKRSRYMGFFQLRGIPERRIVADDFKWLRALIREWSPGWNFSEEDFRPLKAAFSDPVRLAAALTYYRAIPRALTERESWALLYTQIKLPACMIGPEMFEGQEKFFGAGFELMTTISPGFTSDAETRSDRTSTRRSGALEMAHFEIVAGLVKLRKSLLEVIGKEMHCGARMGHVSEKDMSHRAEE